MKQHAYNFPDNSDIPKKKNSVFFSDQMDLSLSTNEKFNE